MRASLLVPCALAVAFAALGCKDAARREAPQRSAASGDALTAPSAVPALDGGAEQASTFVVPEADAPPATIVRKDSPNMRYAQLGRGACLAELERRAIAFVEAPPTEWARRSHTPVASLEKAVPKTKPAPARKAATKQGKPAKAAMPAKPAPSAPGVAASAILAPVRLRGPLHGVTIHSALPEKQRAKSTTEIFDCRLVLALDDFASVLAQHQIVEAIHMSAFRSQRDRGCTPKYNGKQHCAALAVDVGTFKKQDQSVLDVDKDWNGRLGAKTCTAGAGPSPMTPAATELWDIVCEAARRGLFHVVLTPNFNAEHKNHLHLEITPDVDWMLID